MTRRLFVFEEPDRFVAGTIGEPGGRTFFLQARKGGAVVSVVLEKAQVAVLAQRLNDLLDLVGEDAALPLPDRDDRALDEPLVDVFRVGPMALAWDSASSRVVFEAQPQNDDGEYRELPDSDSAGPDVMRVIIGPGMAREFVRRAESLVAAGRPTCPFCGEPLDPAGHFCTRTNAHLN